MSAKDLLKRGLAPVLPQAWRVIDDEAGRVLRLNLAGRKIVDFAGPHGWDLAGVNTGRLQVLPPAGDPDVIVGIRQVQPRVELRVPFLLPVIELDAVARGGAPDLTPIVRAAEKVARAEDAAVFGGSPPAAIAGLIPASPHPPQRLPGNVLEMPRAVLAAKELLRQAGVSGPYALVLGAQLYDQVFAVTEEGHPLAKRIEQLLVDRPIVRALAMDGGVVLSVRGGDYELTVGQDLSVGYAFHDRQTVELYLTESFTFRVLEPAAAVRLLP